MRTFRSLLFVPGHKPDWVDKAVRAGADAVILDLEDSVPENSKNDARGHVAETIERLSREAGSIGILVRPNAFDTDHFAADLESVVRPGLDGLLVPKLRDENDIHKLDGVLTFLEVRHHLPRGTVELVPSLETAGSVANAHQLARSPRVTTLQTATARDGDIARELGFRWSAGGLETVAFRSNAILACRSNGLHHPLCGVWQEISDIEGLRAFATQNRNLGFRGQLVLHPSHVPVVNDIYSVSSSELARAQRLIAAFELAVDSGSAAAMFEGEHIDVAHVKTSRDLIDLARRQENQA
ncbi:CoA ester lyase [Rhodococcus sp. 15-1154-1]|nr:CoA ester lyase [Rhodococcus sp. 15-1154-1]OZF02509.1 CoA ester lyase [Rhodococcus sp. 15-1154-1]